MLDDHTVYTFADDGHFSFVFDLPAFLSETGAAAGTGAVKAPMTGTIKEVLVKEGDVVVKDQPVVIMVAMKMEVRLCACACVLACLLACLPALFLLVCLRLLLGARR